MFTIGIISDMFISNTLGSAGKSLGKAGSPFAKSTLSFTFLSASSGEMLKSNSIKTVE